MTTIWRSLTASLIQSSVQSSVLGLINRFRRHERGSEDEEEMKRRQKLAAWEMSHAQYYDYVVVNENADVAARDILEIVKAERARRKAATAEAPGAN